MTAMAAKKSLYQTKPKAPAAKPFGFGFLPAVSEHHFLVTLDKTSAMISEHLHYDESDARREVSLALGKEEDKLRVMLPLAKWNAIAEEVREVFNDRLKAVGLAGGRWGKTTTPVSRLLGKELVLLAWAIEDADPGLTPTALANWKGLAPEERWWLYTMTNAATGHAIQGRGRGWRKAIRFALTENPLATMDDVSREGLFTLVREGATREI